MKSYDKLFINGRWIAPRGGEYIEVINPSTELVIGRIPAATAADVADAVSAARAAFAGWAATSVAQRTAVLQRLSQLLLDRADEIARTITTELGMPLKLAQRIQAGLPPAVMDSFAKLLSEYQFEEQIGNSLVIREPVGVVGCITPWNYPLHQVVAKVAPALAAGCTVVVKPSELAPLSIFLLAEIVEQADLPPGVFNLVSGTGEVAGETLAEHPEVDMISFTGSTRAGKRVAELAAQSVKRVALELGGKSASIILKDADLPTAVKGTVNSCFLNSGQTCTALTRMLVPESRYRDAAELAVGIARGFSVGDPMAGEAKLGPLVSAAQRERVRGFIFKGVAEGAELLLGGPEPPEGLVNGYYVRPTVFGRVAPTATIAREEIFGPVLSIILYRDEEEAVRIANESLYGLAGAVWGGDAERARSVARRIRAGQIDINGGRFNLLAPFGGFKQSGYGREFGRYGLEEFLEVKALQQ